MNRKILYALIFGFIIGSLWLIAVRFVAIKSDDTHYHANFALYINGVREEFKSPLYYEEVQSCSEETANDPKTRVHMHNQENSIIHVHDQAAAWGHFMANLGFGLSNTALVTDKGITHTDGQGGELTFVLNGETVDSVANKLIGDKDVLLISFGNESVQKLDEYHDAIPTDAHKYNDQVDPAGCSGNQPLSFTQRLKSAIGLDK